MLVLFQCKNYVLILALGCFSSMPCKGLEPLGRRLQPICQQPWAVQVNYYTVVLSLCVPLIDWAFGQLLQTCSRVSCYWEQRRHAGDSGVTHYRRIVRVGSTSHTAWMRNLMRCSPALHYPGLSDLIQDPCCVQVLACSAASINNAFPLMASTWRE